MEEDNEIEMDDDFQGFTEEKDPMPYFFAPSPLSENIPNLDKKALFGALQCRGTDEEVAALFGLDVEEFKEIIESDPELSRIYRHAPLVGNLAVKKAQHDSAVAGDKVMLKHLGEHNLGQVDAKPPSLSIEVNAMEDEEKIRRMAYAFALLENKKENEIIEVEAIKDGEEEQL